MSPVDVNENIHVKKVLFYVQNLPNSAPPRRLLPMSSPPLDLATLTTGKKAFKSSLYDGT